MTGGTVASGRFVRSPALSRIIVPGVRALGHWYYRARTLGQEHIPADRPVIYVSKHPRTFLYLETVLLGVFAFWDSHRPPFRVLEMTGTSIHRTPVLGWMRRRVNAVPATEEHALEALAHGESLLIFPGGTRELYGAPGVLRWQGRTGFARLAIAAGVEVLPVAIDGADRQHWGRLPLRGASLWLPPIPLPVRLTYRFGAPIPPRARETPAAFAARVEDAVRTLMATAPAGAHRA